MAELKTAPGFPELKKSLRPPFQMSYAMEIKQEQTQKCEFITGSSRKITDGSKRLSSLSLLHFVTCV